MRSSSRRNQNPTNVALIDFAFKILVPAIPVVGISIAAIYLVNADIAGEYKGSAPKTGAVALVLNEKSGHLSGELILKDRFHFPIREGHMMDEQKLELVFQQPPMRLRAERHTEGNAPTFVGTHDQNSIEGLFNYGSLEIPLKLKRGATAAFFSRRWFERFVDYFGGKSQ